MNKQFRERVTLMLIEDRVRFLAILGVILILLVIAIFTDRVRDVLLALSMIANLLFGYEATKSIGSNQKG